MRTPVILLSCGCFNPTTNMHLRMFEIARDFLHRMGQYEVVGGIISPVHDGYGKKDLVSASHRLNMLRLSLQDNDWVKLSEWETRQESWTRTRQILQYHQNQVNAHLQSENNDVNEEELKWLPDDIKQKCQNNRVVVKLLCGADLLESFGTPGLWSDDDIKAIVGQHGLVVITRSNVNPNEFIYNSDLLTKYMANITIVTEWVRNEISSTKVRRALRRSESVRYLISDKVIDYIYKHALYGAKTTKYLCTDVIDSVFLTPSPTMDPPIESSPTNCLYICNNNIFNRNQRFDKISLDSFKSHQLPRHPGQAVKVVTECADKVKNSKSCADFEEIELKRLAKGKGSLKECKSCDENLVKFIFTKHGIQVISDVETVV